MSKFTILTPINAPGECYLFEVLRWRAFGQFPQEAWPPDRDPWRFSETIRDSVKAPTLTSEYLSEEECLYAGIPYDPRTEWRLEGYGRPDPEEDRKILDIARRLDPPEPKSVSECEARLDVSLKRQVVINSWLPIYREYVDEFQNEIYLDLRRGNLVAYGTELPNSNYEQTEKILEEREIWLNDLDVVEVPTSHWVSSNVDWDDSTLFGREKSFIWIFVDVDDMIERYPPELLLKPDQIAPLGENFAVASSTVGGMITPNSMRGRPSLPWDQFHVQIAKIYHAGTMPEKKEAAIAMLQEWFVITLGKSVSRSAIGQKLKPYFDEIQVKDRNS